MDLLQQMATFVRVVDGKSLSSAARALGLSLPAVSRQLRALEQDLGAQLIVRSTRQLHVTDRGRRFYEHAQRVLREVQAARESASGSDQVSGRLVVSASLTYGALEVVPRIKRLTEQHPRLSIDLRLEDHLVDLVGEGVDIAIRAGSLPPDSTSYVAHPLADMRRILVASPAFQRRHGAVREPSDLSRRPCLVQVTLAGLPIPWKLERDGSACTIDVGGQLRVNAPLALRELALVGAGIAYIPDFVVASELVAGSLRRVLPAWSSSLLRAVAIHRVELRDSPRVRAFLAAFAARPPRGG